MNVHGIIKEGWYCSGEVGHRGPCAAWPVSHEAAEQLHWEPFWRRVVAWFFLR